jgi:uncharacterized coiled-coil protein SlyX
MESEHTESSATPITKHQEKLDGLMEKLPEVAKQSGDALNALLGEISQIKTTAAAAEPPQRLKYYSAIIEQTLKNLNDTNTDELSRLKIKSMLHGLEPRHRGKTLAEKHQKRDPLKPSDSDRQIT